MCNADLRLCHVFRFLIRYKPSLLLTLLKQINILLFYFPGKLFSSALLIRNLMFEFLQRMLAKNSIEINITLCQWCTNNFWLICNLMSKTKWWILLQMSCRVSFVRFILINACLWDMFVCEHIHVSYSVSLKTLFELKSCSSVWVLPWILKSWIMATLLILECNSLCQSFHWT